MLESSAWLWPLELDAVIAAPRHHKLIFENERVRVLDTRIPAGETVPVHTHRWPAVYYTLNFSHFIRRDGDGKILFDSRTTEKPVSFANWLENLPPHSVENVGNAEIHLVSFELKTA